MKIIFFGTSEFAIPILEKITHAGYMPALIVSTLDKPKGRNLTLSPSPTKKWALTNALPVITPERLKDEAVIKALRGYQADVFLIASYGKIIPKEILNIPPKGTINVHPSLLPRLRGPSPIQYTILQNETPGVTIMLTDKEVDHGPILQNKKLDIKNKKYYYKELENDLAKLGGELLIEILPKWMRGEIRPTEQDHSKATFTKKITKEDGHINWGETAEIIERKIRAFNPWPGTYTFWLQPRKAGFARRDLQNKSRLGEQDSKKMRLLILETVIGDGVSKPPGTAFQTKNGDLAVAAQNGILIINKIKPEGKKEMDGKEFLKGYIHITGTILT